MTDDTKTPADRIGSLRINERWGRDRVSDRTNILRELNSADLLSLVALFLAWSSALTFLSDDTNAAIVLMFSAFVFDKLDGYWARRRGISSDFGRRIDSYVDVFAYLVTGALLFHYELAPHRVVSAIVGFAVLAFGGLRLIRHNVEGFDSDTDDVSYYHGTTVVHTNVVILLNYVVVSYVGAWGGWVAAATTLVACPFMVSDYRSPKTYWSHVILGAIAVGVTALVLFAEYGQ